MPTFTVPPLSLTTSLGDRADVTIVGLADAAGSPVLVGAPDSFSSAHAKRFGTPLLDLARSLGASPRVGSTVVLPGVNGLVVVTGLGDADVTPERVRRAAAHGVRKALEVGGERDLTVAVSLEVSEPEIVAAAGEGALLATYRYQRPGKPEKRATVARLELVAPKSAQPVAENVVATVQAVCLARDWVNTPANLLYPESFADAARDAAKGLKLSVEVLDEKALARGGFGGVLAVGGGSVRLPRVVKVSYAPRGAKTHLALIGKGMTFDSGGLNLKPADGMYTMQSDMGGAAAVLAAITAIARLGLDVRVTAYAGMAENMPSGSAFRPSDVLTMHSGTTVENGNSDAEGRLVLADLLSWASEERPDLMVDVATLTGAMVVALGERTTGFVTNDDDTADAILDAAESAGENMWLMPIPEEMKDALKSDVADLKSTGARWGGALYAGAFLREFVGEGISWAHLDIAPTAWSDKQYDYVTKGGTGAGVRTLVALARSLQG